jgi:excinuclease UvrABC ATPase subunit
MTERYVTPDANPERFRLFRLCDCPTCGGRGKAHKLDDGQLVDYTGGIIYEGAIVRCEDCRGEGRVRQELATCATPEAVGVALVTLAREGEWNECPFGLLDSEPPCETCGGTGEDMNWLEGVMVECFKCKGSGIKPTGTWLITPWLPSARNVTDAARTLAKSKKSVS